MRGGRTLRGRDGTDTELGRATTTTPIFPGQVSEVTLSTTEPDTSTFVAKVLIDPDAPTFQQCRDDNDESEPVMARCLL